MEIAPISVAGLEAQRYESNKRGSALFGSAVCWVAEESAWRGRQQVGADFPSHL
jgi:hypothetical protein